jgi:hypothetical protein
MAVERILNVAIKQRWLATLATNPCVAVELPVSVSNSTRKPLYITASEQKRIAFNAPGYLRNAIVIMTEMGLRPFKELMPMTKSQVDLDNSVVHIPDSKTPSGIGNLPMTALAREAFRAQIDATGPHNVDHWLKPAAFANPTHAMAIGQMDYSPLGGSPGNAIGSGFHRVDISLFKQFHTSEKTRRELRAEAFQPDEPPELQLSWVGRKRRRGRAGLAGLQPIRSPSARSRPRAICKTISGGIQFALNLYF